MDYVLEIVGIVLVLASAAAGKVFGFSEDWMVEVVGAFVTAAGIIISKAKTVKTAGGKVWQVYLVGFGIGAGVCIAVVGGMTQANIITLIGCLIAALAIIIPVIKKIFNTSST